MTILADDDDEAILSLYADTLGTDPRYRIIFARDGEEALALAESEHPDLVLLDIILPKINGWDVCGMLKSNSATSRAKVVMVSVLIQSSHRRKAAELGADGYLTKPLDIRGLPDAVEDILGRA